MIAAGPFANRALEAAAQIKEEYGWSPAIYNIRYIKPLDQEIMKEVVREYDRIITVEDGTTVGGLYGAVSEYVSVLDHPVSVTPIWIG